MAKRNVQHKADWLLRCSVTSDNGWFKTAALKRAAPPSADTQTGFFACTFYLVFKEPLRRPHSRPTRSPSLGEPSKHIIAGPWRQPFFAFNSQLFLAAVCVGMTGAH
jgi:hypothetical protein